MKVHRLLFVGLLIGIILSGCTSSSSEPASSAPTVSLKVAPLEVTIEMSEYAFNPAEIEAEVGQEVTLTLVNVGTLEHELMIGNDVEMPDGVPSGYETDMFRTGGIIPTVHGGGMLMAHDEAGHQAEGEMAMADDEHEEGMAMEEDDHEEGMAMEEDEHEEGMAMEGEDHEEGMAMNLEGEGALMVMMPVGTETTTVSFTVTEDMIGEWEMGCFQLDGVHYNSGMVGTFTVKE